MAASTDFVIVGAGLAGCECALTLARHGLKVRLVEQKPEFRSAAHASPDFCELVCSNSLRSDEESSGVGLLKREMRLLESPFMAVADACRIPAGKALAVDREAFARRMTRAVCGHPYIMIEHARIESLDDPRLWADSPAAVIIAAGPLASDSLSASIAGAAGSANCYFYDAIAPIVWTHSLNMEIVFRGSRYEDGEGDYLNCPMNRDEFERFMAALAAAETFRAREGEEEKHFEGCMPIEALAARDPRSLTFGPMKPVGFVDPRSGERPWAVLQLRAEKANLETCNLVGCQTKLLQKEQRRVFGLVPGLEDVEFLRYGSMHRNTYVNAPAVLNPDLSLKTGEKIYLAGQISGVEGYVESAACGLWLGLSLAFAARGMHLARPPLESALGALLNHLGAPCKHFQPSNIHFGLMPELGLKVKKKERKQHYAARAKEAFASWLAACRLP